MLHHKYTSISKSMAHKLPKIMVQLPNQLSGQEVISGIKFIRIKLVPFQKKNTHL